MGEGAGDGGDKRTEKTSEFNLRIIVAHSHDHSNHLPHHPLRPLIIHTSTLRLNLITHTSTLILMASAASGSMGGLVDRWRP